MSSVLVLNAGYEPLHRVSVRHAIRMLVREVAVVEEVIEGQTIGNFPMPSVLRLVRYVKLHWRKEQPKWSKKRLSLGTTTLVRTVLSQHRPSTTLYLAPTVEDQHGRTR